MLEAKGAELRPPPPWVGRAGGHLRRVSFFPLHQELALLGSLIILRDTESIRPTREALSVTSVLLARSHGNRGKAKLHSGEGTHPLPLSSEVVELWFNSQSPEFFLLLTSPPFEQVLGVRRNLGIDDGGVLTQSHGGQKEVPPYC